MKLKILQMVGDVSDWIYLADAARDMLQPTPQKGGESDDDYKERVERLRNAADAEVEVFGDAAIKVRVVSDIERGRMSELGRLSVIALEEAQEAEANAELDTATVDDKRRAVQLTAEAGTAEIEAEKHAIKAALAELRGFEVEEVTPDVIEALSVTPYRWILAALCRRYQSVSPEARAGFFTRAQAD